MTLNAQAVGAEFPILRQTVAGQPLLYLDNASSSQKPQTVLDAVARGYAEEYANVHRGLHHLSGLATERYESARETVARFLNAASEAEIVFTSGATEAINLVSYGWAAPCLGPGDEIILSIMEHHANIVPWHFLRERQGVSLRWLQCDAEGRLDPQAVIDAIGPATKLIALTHMSNVLGTLVDVGAVCAAARAVGVPVLIDGAQAAAHVPVDVQAIGCDFYAITGHKLYGPSGSGALYVRADRAAEMRPFMGGGDMIRGVTRDTVSYAAPPLRFEAGTPAIVAQIGLGAALDYLTALGRDRIATHEARLCDYAARRLGAIDGLHLHGTAPEKGPIFAFHLDAVPAPQTVAIALDERGIAIRAGSFCAQPLMRHIGHKALCRASFAVYNDVGDVDVLAHALEEIVATSSNDLPPF